MLAREKRRAAPHLESGDAEGAELVVAFLSTLIANIMVAWHKPDWGFEAADLLFEIAHLLRLAVFGQVPCDQNQVHIAGVYLRHHFLEALPVMRLLLLRIAGAMRVGHESAPRENF